jgi:RNA polymerase primary sigma factor
LSEENDQPGEPSEDDDISGDFAWSEEDSETLWQAVMDAKLTASADEMRAFLKLVNNVVALSAEEEAQLTKRIEAGRQATKTLNDMAERGEQPTDAQRSALMRIRRDGDRAREDLLKAHLPLVISLAKRNTGRGMAFLDLIEVGTIGITRAAEKFDFTKGYRFSVYATWWIRQSISRTIAT